LRLERRTVVYEFLGRVKRKMGDKTVWVLVCRRPHDPGQSSIIIPNRYPRGKECDPDPAMWKVVKKLMPGDMFEASVTTLGGKTLCHSLKAFKAAAGENEPGTFILGKLEPFRIKDQPYMSVELTKLKRTQKVFLPNVKDEQGKLVPDARMIEKIKSLKQGSVVVALVTRSRQRFTLREIREYVPPEEGEFVRFVAESSDDGGKAGVIVKIDGEEKTLPVIRVKQSGKMVADPKVVAAARRLKPGRHVTCELRKDGEKIFLTKIEAVTKNSAPPSRGRP